MRRAKFEGGLRLTEGDKEGVIVGVRYYSDHDLWLYSIDWSDTPIVLLSQWDLIKKITSGDYQVKGDEEEKLFVYYESPDDHSLSVMRRESVIKMIGELQEKYPEEFTLHYRLAISDPPIRGGEVLGAYNMLVMKPLSPYERTL